MNLEDIRYWWEDLELRKKLEENQSIVVIALLVVILFSLGLVTCQLLGGGRGSFSKEVDLVYFDVTNGTIKIVNHEYPEIPKSPLDGTDDVFMARVFSCENCPEGQLKDGMTVDDLKANNMFIGWLERTDPNATQEMLMLDEAKQYRTLAKDRWYKTSDPAYEKIMQAFNQRCDRAYPCMP